MYSLEENILILQELDKRRGSPVTYHVLDGKVVILPGICESLTRQERDDVRSGKCILRHHEGTPILDYR